MEESISAENHFLYYIFHFLHLLFPLMAHRVTRIKAASVGMMVNVTEVDGAIKEWEKRLQSDMLGLNDSHQQMANVTFPITTNANVWQR
jgi:hypothetical protein